MVELTKTCKDNEEQYAIRAEARGQELKALGEAARSAGRGDSPDVLLFVLWRRET